MQYLWRWCLCGMVLFASLYGTVSAQEVWMPDPNLRQAVREALRLTIDTPLTKEGLQTLTNLDAQHRSIVDVRGLEFAHNLVGLNLGNNQIQDITPLQNLTQLEGLSLYENQVSDISPLAPLTRLGGFNGAHNPITDLTPLANHVNLYELDLFDCRVSDVRPIAGLKNLQKLNLSGNNIMDFSPLANLTNLRELDIKGNPADDIGGLQHLTLTHFLHDIVCEIEPSEIPADLSAQEAWMPDPNLRHVVRETLCLPTDRPLTKEGLQALEKLDARGRGIVDLRGLEFAHNLSDLNLGSNQIQDITPLQNLTQLKWLGLNDNRIQDITPLQNLIQLVELNLYNNQVSDLSPLMPLTRLGGFNGAHNLITDLTPLANHVNLYNLDLWECRVSDVRPIAGLKNLQRLILYNNGVLDFSPLANLTNLQVLDIRGSFGADIRPLQGLPLTDFKYDEACEIEPPGPPIASRFEARTYPSIFQAWEPLIGFQGEETLKTIHVWDDREISNERAAKHDLLWHSSFGLKWDTHPGEPAYGLSTRLAGDLADAEALRQEQLALNPNMLFLVEVRIHNHLNASAFPPDSPFWLRDSNNQVIESVYSSHTEYPMDFLNPALQDLLIERMVAVARCGLFDGVMIDGFNSNGTGFVDRHHFPNTTDAEIIAATTRILRGVRARVPDNFLILVNANRSKPTAYTEYVNGVFMENALDHPGGYTYDGLREVADTLLWADANLRAPQVNCLHGWGLETEPRDSPENQRWMRVYTTMHLTHSNGYVLYAYNTIEHGGFAHIWYDFWDANLGQPIGEKGQRYENREGLFIREFTNGWAVYNRSGSLQRVELPEQATGVESGRRHTLHIVPDLDGEIFLKDTSDPRDVNKDGVINVLDLVTVANAFGQAAPDINGDGNVNVLDLIQVANRIGQ